MDMLKVDRGRAKEPFNPTLFSCCRGLGIFLWLWLSGTMGVIFFTIIPYMFSMLFLRPHLYRRLADELIGSFFIYGMALLEHLMGLKVVITGDQMHPGERSLIIMNHRTRLDWLYFWSVLIRQSGVKTEKIILKSLLKKIPGAGWAMQVGGFIFIERKWESDKKVLSKMMNYFADLDHKTQVLLFPEGTDLTARTKARSDEFAKKNGWKTYDYCLHPRTTGFTYLVQLMRQNNHLDVVYDVTVAYPYNFPQREPELLMGNVPREVHFHIERHSINTLPVGEDELKTWCQQRWEEKEQRLSQFYKDNAFTSKPTASGDKKVKCYKCSADLKMLLALVYWTAFIIGIALMLYYSALARWFSIFQLIFYVYMGHMYGGFEIFQVDYFNWFFKRKQKSKD